MRGRGGVGEGAQIEELPPLDLYVAIYPFLNVYIKPVCLLAVDVM